jgi:hypothetical protein
MSAFTGLLHLPRETVRNTGIERVQFRRFETPRREVLTLETLDRFRGRRAEDLSNNKTSTNSKSIQIPSLIRVDDQNDPQQQQNKTCADAFKW